METETPVRSVYRELKQVRDIKTLDAGAAAILDFLMADQDNHRERLVELLANPALITEAIEAMKSEVSVRRLIRFPDNPAPMVHRLILSRLASDHNLSDLMKIAELVTARREKLIKNATS